MEGQGVIALVGLDIVGGVEVVVVTVVLGIRVTNVLDNTRSFPINLTLYCFLFAW